MYSCKNRICVAVQSQTNLQNDEASRPKHNNMSRRNLAITEKINATISEYYMLSPAKKKKKTEKFNWNG